MNITREQMVQSIPIEPNIPNYQITFTDFPETLEAPLSQLTAPDEPVFPLVADDSAKNTNDTFPSLPKWIQNNTCVTLFQDGSRRCGTISPPSHLQTPDGYSNKGQQAAG
jgi:hypothetical protein